MKKFVVRDRFNRGEPVHLELSGEPTPVKQEFQAEVNINSIIAKMKRGIMPPSWMTSGKPVYSEEFADMPKSLMEAYDVVARAEDAFRTLPLAMRRELDHDPRNLEGATREFFERHGLLKPDEPKAPEGAKGRKVRPEGSGDRDLPSTGRLGLDKGGPKVGSKPPVDSSEED